MIRVFGDCYSIAHLIASVVLSLNLSAPQQTDVCDDTDDDRLPMGRHHPLYESSRRLLGGDGQP